MWSHAARAGGCITREMRFARIAFGPRRFNDPVIKSELARIEAVYKTSLGESENDLPPAAVRLRELCPNVELL
ncbi:hypothetical protein EVAR_28521_1 [Eumeta japonica]|uniref:Uncharacterized protein n=1 Tax=Eumeta variegata TaxID=151549 RepID=A0A4C1WP64_EUMVA|nr:hypothetical protein EVAR_28521_1 [Eumeta japonica]